MMKNENKLSSIMFKLLFSLQQNNICNSKWVSLVKSIFDDRGLSYIFMNQLYIDLSLFKPIIKQTRDQFIQRWHRNINNSSRGSFYGLFKYQFGTENYLIKLSNQAKRFITKL